MKRKSPPDAEAYDETKPCHLLNLPLELQLPIYELVVIENRPLLLNCPCNSSYRGRIDELRTMEEAWKSGKMLPPKQPALTRTCRFIRSKSLPLFYQHNVFRAHYCLSMKINSLDLPIKWLRMIGEENRKALRHLYFYDRNEYQDRGYSERRIEELRASDIFETMGGKGETLSSQDCCAHLVTFGTWEKRPGEMAVALEPKVPRLRLEGEV